MDGYEFLVHPDVGAQGWQWRPARYQDFSSPVKDYAGNPTGRVAVFRYCLSDDIQDDRGRFCYEYLNWSEACV